MSKERELLNRMAEQLRTVLFLSDDAKQLIAEYDAVTAPDPPKDAGRIPAEVVTALDRMCMPLDPSRLSGATAAADALCMQFISDYIYTHPSAPSADRRDAERYRWIRENDCHKALYREDASPLIRAGNDLDTSIDAAIEKANAR